MSRGNSGRIVLEVDPTIKKQLYLLLTREGITLKTWFLQQCEAYITDYGQPQLFAGVAAELKPKYSLVAGK
jgi:hypothetical protein